MGPALGTMGEEMVEGVEEEVETVVAAAAVAVVAEGIKNTNAKQSCVDLLTVVA